MDKTVDFEGLGGGGGGGNFLLLLLLLPVPLAPVQVVVNSIVPLAVECSKLLPLVESLTVDASDTEPLEVVTTLC